EFSALASDAKLLAKQGLSSGGAKGDYHFRFDGRDLGLEPRPAGLNFPFFGLLVNASFAAELPLEVLYDIGNVDLPAINAGLFQRLIEQSAGRPYERPALEILFVTWLFADEYQPGVRSAFTEYSLGRIFP